MKINNPENFKLPTFGPQFNYLIAKNDSYFLYLMKQIDIKINYKIHFSMEAFRWKKC